MNLSQLPATSKRGKKRVGRGYGSGKGGHTVGRGAKGNKARGKIPMWFEGGQLPLIRRLPFQRGKNRFGKLTGKPVIVPLAALNLLPSGTKVTVDGLIKQGIVKEAEAKKWGVKILGNGELKQAITVLVPMSKSAAARIVKAGGKLE